MAKFKETKEKMFALAGLLGMLFWWGGEYKYHIFAALPSLTLSQSYLKMKLSMQQWLSSALPSGGF